MVTNNWRKDAGKEAGADSDGATVACRLCANLHMKAGRVTADECDSELIIRISPINLKH